MNLRTLLRYRQPGRPRSRENDQIIREELARAAIMALKTRTAIMQAMTVAPAFDLVVWVKMAMNGYPVGVATAAVMSPMQNKMASNMANARSPLMARLPIIVQGTTVEAFLVSSHICSGHFSTFSLTCLHPAHDPFLFLEPFLYIADIDWTRRFG